MYGELPKVKGIDASGAETEMSAFPVVIESSPTGPKTALLRLPTTTELLTYLSARRTLSRDLGRGKSKEEPVFTPDADQKIFRAIRLDKGSGSVEFDDAEALYALDLITRHKVTSCERQGQQYVVTLMTMFGECVHTVRMPYQSERSEYQSRCFQTTYLPDNLEQRRFPPEVPVKLYDHIIIDATGYANFNGANSTIPIVDVPPHHKRSVIIAVLTAISHLDPDFGGDSDPNS